MPGLKNANISIPMLNNLNSKQKEAVLCTEGPLMILAGAGSGKTRVLTTRIKYLLTEKNILPEHILAVTFTNKAAREMEARIGCKLPWIGTFHGICGKLLRRHIQLLPGYDSNYVIYDDADQTALIKNILGEDKQLTPYEVLKEIGLAKNRMFSPQKYEQIAEGDYQKEIVSLYKKYQASLLKNNALDFDDMLLLTVELFQKNPDLLARYQEQFKYVLVDEYQDTNRAQYLLIHLLAARHKNICVVGDSDQNIYSWRGADITNILSFEQDYPQANIILLEQNYRSTDNILRGANTVIKNNEQRKEKNLWTENARGEKYEFILLNSEIDEANYVADTIEQTRGAVGALNNYAVFYRTNDQFHVFEKVFVKRGIAYRSVSNIKLYARKEVKDILAYLRVITNPADSISLQRIINLPARGIGDLTLGRYTAAAEQRGENLFDLLGEPLDGLTERAVKVTGDFKKMIRDLQTIAQTLPLSEIINETIVRSGCRDLLADSKDKADPKRLDNVYELVSIAQAKEPLGLNEFLEQVSLMADIDSLKEEGDAVTLMTIHNTKGLEFPIVFLTGLEEGILPHFRSLNDKQIEEERRLCYVAITRAKQKLYLSATRQRFQAGKTRRNEVSRFVNEIPEDLLQRTETEAHLFTPVDIPEYLTRQPAPATQTDIANYETGDKIFHNVYGNGTVQRVFGSGEDQALDIQFLRVRKSILVKYAKLKKL